AYLGPLLTGGLAGALLTYFLKARSEKRQKKIVNITISNISLSLPNIRSRSVVTSNLLRVSFEGKEFDNLSMYSARLQNVGSRGVEGMKFVIQFPGGTTILRPIVSS